MFILSADEEERSMMPRPNIVYIHSHDSGRFVQPYGHPVSTPNIQKLAEGGVVFRQAFCAGPTCSPSRASLLTGQWPHANGMLGLAHRGFSLYDYGHHMAHVFGKAGYRTTLIGQQHLTSVDRYLMGYDHVVEEIHHAKAANVVPHAVKFFEDKPQEPFFAAIGFSETHREFPEPGPSEDPRWCQPAPPLPDTPVTRRDMACYKASVRVFDEAVGKVIDALEASGLAENTLVICTTDHGIDFPRMKCTLYDHGIGVMLIMRGPGGFTGGKVVDAMVSHVDVYPTLCELAGIDPPAWLDGLSMMPLIRGDAESIRDEVFSEITYHATYEPTRSARTTRWKYIRHFGSKRTKPMPNVDDCPTKTLWVDHGWRDHEVPEEELYDLVFDPHELNNLAGCSGHAEALADMRGRLDRYMKDTDDPLLKGEVPPPEGARVNDPDGASPREPALENWQP
jgi:arylsulfatase A-like enzyme